MLLYLDLISVFAHRWRGWDLKARIFFPTKARYDREKDEKRLIDTSFEIEKDKEIARY